MAHCNTHDGKDANKMNRRLAKVLIVAALGLMGVFAVYRHAFDGMANTPAAAAKAADEHAEEKGHDAVVLNDAKIAEAGIELAKAGPGVLRASVVLNGILQPNQEALVQVTPRFPGVFRELAKRVGDRVEKNDLLGKIESNQSLTVYELRSPIAGTIIDRQASLGEFASDQKPAFIVADLATVWADFAVYRRDLGRVKEGSAVLLDPEDGGAPVEAKLAYVSPVGNAETQSALARAVVGNMDRRLRPGLFVTGRVLLDEKPVALAVKVSALQTHENKTVVFVREGERFDARPVQVGERDAEHAEVKNGLAEGEVYAANNSFVVKAEIGKGSAGHVD
jgi:multidrug efflux pump subunit AcrA (membrane-fusion protein)